MVRPDIGYDMVRCIDTELREVIKLSGLARLDTDAGIRIGRAVMRFIASVLTPFVPCSGTLILIFAPTLVASSNGLKFFFIGGYTALTFI